MGRFTAAGLLTLALAIAGCGGEKRPILIGWGGPRAFCVVHIAELR